MPNRILIADEVATNRIVLKVKLAAASYDVSQASSYAAALDTARQQRPRLIIISDRLGGSGGAERFCRALASDPATAAISVIVLGPDRGQAERLALLSAGAADLIVRPFDSAALLARIRSLMRQNPLDFSTGIDTLGFVEAAPQRPAPPALIGIVTPDRETGLRWRAALAGRLRDPVALLHPDTLFDTLRHQAVPDIFVISAERMALTDLRLIAELRSRLETEAAPVIVAGGDHEPEFGIMALDLGAGDVLPGRFDAEELALRLRARLRQKRAGERQRRHLVEGLRLAATDALTGLRNRRGTFARLGAIAQEAVQAGRGYGLMILDIDRFKLVNDRHGHAAGDEVLCEVARRLAANMRGEDLLGRIGGEEFLVALPQTSLVQARMAAERLRRVIEAAPVLLPDGASIYVTLSIGLCLGGTRPETVAQIFDRADRALYAAKARGRNTVKVGRPAA